MRNRGETHTAPDQGFQHTLDVRQGDALQVRHHHEGLLTRNPPNVVSASRPPTQRMQACVVIAANGGWECCRTSWDPPAPTTSPSNAAFFGWRAWPHPCGQDNLKKKVYKTKNKQHNGSPRSDCSPGTEPRDGWAPDADHDPCDELKKWGSRMSRPSGGYSSGVRLRGPSFL